MNDSEPFHLCFIDVYQGVNDADFYVLVRSGGELPKHHLEDQGIQVQSLKLLRTRQSLTRAAYRWGRPGVHVHRDIQTEGACVVSLQALQAGRRAFIIRRSASAAIGSLLSFGLAWWLRGPDAATGIHSELTTLLLASSALIGAFMGWEGAAAFEEETPEHLHIDYRAKFFSNNRSEGPPGSGA